MIVEHVEEARENPEPVKMKEVYCVDVVVVIPVVDIVYAEQTKTSKTVQPIARQPIACAFAIEKAGHGSQNPSRPIVLRIAHVHTTNISMTSVLLFLILVSLPVLSIVRRKVDTSTAEKKTEILFLVSRFFF